MTPFLLLGLAASIALNVMLWRGEEAWKRYARHAERQADKYFEKWSALYTARSRQTAKLEDGGA